MHQLQRCRGNIVRNHTLKVFVALQHATRTRLHVCGFEIASLDLAYGPQTATDHVSKRSPNQIENVPVILGTVSQAGSRTVFAAKTKRGGTVEKFPKQKKMFMKIRQGTLYIRNWEKHSLFLAATWSNGVRLTEATGMPHQSLHHWCPIGSTSSHPQIWGLSGVLKTRFLPLGTGRTLQTWRRLSTVSPNDIEFLNYPMRSILIHLWQLDCAFNLQYKKSYFLET